MESAGVCRSLDFDTTSRSAQSLFTRRSLGKSLPVDAVQSHLRRESAPFRMPRAQVTGISTGPRLTLRLAAPRRRLDP